MKIVTGYTGSPHITSNDEQGKNQGIFGAGNSVLNVGNKFNATLTNANTVTIEDGEGVMQGVHFRIEPGTTETVNIQNGTSGYKRIDLICARYTKNAVTGVEAVNLVVIPGTPAASTPTEPAYTEGDILGGDTQADFPLWKVTLDGLTPAITKVAQERKAFDVKVSASATILTDGIVAGTPGISDPVSLEAGHVYLLYVTGNIEPISSQNPVEYDDNFCSVGIYNVTGDTLMTYEALFGAQHRVSIAWYCAPASDIEVAIEAWARERIVTPNLIMNVVQIA